MLRVRNLLHGFLALSSLAFVARSERFAAISTDREAAVAELSKPPATLNPWMIPDDISHAAFVGDKNAVAEWLSEHPESVEDVTDQGGSLLLLALEHREFKADQLELVRYLISRGADPNRICHIDNDESKGTMTPLYAACGGNNTPLVKEMVASLLRAGANPNLRTESPSMRGTSPLACAINTFLVTTDGAWQLPVVALLLRAGASLDKCFENKSAEDLIAAEEEHYASLIERNVHFRAAATLCRAVRAAGSWQKYCRRQSPHRDVLGLRSLAMRGYITPCQKRRTRGTEWKAIVAFLARLGDNGIVWNILSFWRDPDDIEDVIVPGEDGDPWAVVRVYD